MNMTIARVLGGVGRTLIGSGVIVLLFVVYQLWGTNIQEAQAQDQLEDEFAQVLDRYDDARADADGGADDAGTDDDDTDDTDDDADADDTTSTTDTDDDPAPTTTTAVPTALRQLVYPEEGEPLALIEIPKIGVEKIVVEGVAVDDLKKGPGHYPDNPLPGQPGNAAIAGHRTTYGAPFSRIDELDPGDEITVKTVQGTAVYEVMGTEIVQPTAVYVLDDYGDNRLTLTACHPKRSARQRIILTAQLVSEPFADIPKPGDTTTVEVELPGEPTTTAEPTTTTTVEDTTTTADPSDQSTTTTTVDRDGDDDDESVEEDGTTSTAIVAGGADGEGDARGFDEGNDGLGEGLSGDTDALAPAIMWAIVCAIVGFAAWFAAKTLAARGDEGRPWLRKGIAYALASPVFFFPLWFCFIYVDRVLPAY